MCLRFDCRLPDPVEWHLAVSDVSVGEHGASCDAVCFPFRGFRASDSGSLRPLVQGSRYERLFLRVIPDECTNGDIKVGR